MYKNYTRYKTSSSTFAQGSTKQSMPKLVDNQSCFGIIVTHVAWVLLIAVLIALIWVFPAIVEAVM
jgi:hypothetical protein